MAKIKKETSKKGSMAVVGIGAAAIAAAAGAYWFYGSKEAVKHRKVARSWMLKARADVLEAVENTVEKVGKIDKETYTSIVDGVLERYSNIVGVTKAEMTQVSEDMKETWEHIQKVLKTGAPIDSKK